jgi:hypothetical protein
MNVLPGPDTRAAILRHPFFLAGLAVVALLGLTAGVLVVADAFTGEGAGGEPTVVVAPVGTNTAGPVARTATASGVSGTTRGATAVRTAPGGRTPILGTLAAESDVEIDGRTTDSEWLRIVFPARSELHGWIDAEDVEIVGDPSRLVVATAEPVPIIDVPTQPPSVLTAIAAEDTPDATASAAVTVTPAGGGIPDLVIGTPPTISADGRLFVTVVNQGSGEMKGDLVVAIFNFDGSALVGGATIPRFTLAPGRSIDVGTGYEVEVDQTVVLVVDPNGTIEETDNTNNRVTVAIAVDDEPTIPPPFQTPDDAPTPRPTDTAVVP